MFVTVSFNEILDVNIATFLPTVSPPRRLISSTFVIFFLVAGIWNSGTITGIPNRNFFLVAGIWNSGLEFRSASLSRRLINCLLISHVFSSCKIGRQDVIFLQMFFLSLKKSVFFKNCLFQKFTKIFFRILFSKVAQWIPQTFTQQKVDKS